MAAVRIRESESGRQEAAHVASFCDAVKAAAERRLLMRAAIRIISVERQNCPHDSAFTFNERPISVIQPSISARHERIGSFPL